MMFPALEDGFNLNRIRRNEGRPPLIYKFGERKKDAIFSRKIREKANKMYSRKEHNEKMHAEILLFYSQSAAFAPPDSEELARALSNRSVLLLHFCQYANAIVDIDSAITITKTVLLKCKLICRKIHCLMKLGRPNEAEELSVEAKQLFDKIDPADQKMKERLVENLEADLSIDQTSSDQTEEENPAEFKYNAPYKSEAVELRYSKEYGKHLIVNRRVEAGEVLLVEKVAVVYPLLDFMYVVCSHCLNATWNSIPCKRCVFTVYCSTKCEQEAWDSYHDIECSLNLPFSNKLLSESQYLLTIRMFIKFIKAKGVEELLNRAEYLDKTNANRDEEFSENSLDKFSDEFDFFYGLLCANRPEWRPFTINDPPDNENCQFDFRLITLMTQCADSTEEAEMKALVEECLTPMNYDSEAQTCIYFYIKIAKNTLKALESHSDFQHILTKKDIWNLKRLLLRLLSKGISYYANEQELFFRNLTMPGVGCYLKKIGSFLNHSCFPNASSIRLDNARTLLIANRPIEKNEQISISYGPDLGTPMEERKGICSLYKFECHCVACEEIWPILDDPFFNPPKFSEDYPEAAAFISKHMQYALAYWMGSKTDESTLKDCCSVINKLYKELPLFDAAIVQSTLTESLEWLYHGTYNKKKYVMPSTCSM